MSVTPVEALPGAGGSGADDAPMANTGGRRPEGSGTRRRHEVPTHLDVEDRLMLGLSSRQVAYLLIGLAASIGLWSGWPQIPDPLRLALALVCLGATAAVALVHWNGHGPIEWAFIGLRYAAGARRAVWQPAEAARAGLGSPGGRRHAVQSAHVGIADVADATVHLADGRHRAVLEVGGVDFQLRRADEQEALITAYAAFLNALSFPVQIMVRVQPVDLETHIRHLEQRARGVLAPDLAILAHDHVTFLRRLAGQQALLERRFYVVVPADDAPAGAAGSAAAAAPTARATFGTPGALLAAIGRAVHARLSRSRRPHEGDGGRTGALSTADAEPFGRHTAAPTGAAPTGAALEQLDFRCAEVIRQLGRCGLTARRLDTAALVRLFYTTWCPDLAGVQRRRQPVAAGTVPVVRRAGAGVHPPTASPPPPPHAAGDAGVARPGTARHFVRGMRTVADLVAPAAVEVTRDHVRVDHHFRRTLAVTGYPRTVGPGWLAPLLYASETLELSLHVQPLPTGETVRHLSHKLVQLHSSRLVDARGGRLADPEREIAYDDVERLRDALQRGEERVFATSLYLHLRAHSIDGLDGLTRRVEAVLDGMLAQSRVALLQQDVGLRSCLPLGDDRLLVYRNLDTSSLATTFPFAADALTMERGVFYGVARHGHTAVVVDPFDPTLENANTAVIATSGAGKSYFTKLMALRHGLLGVDVLVIDPEDEYHRLCIAVGGQYLRFSATARERLNPFDLPPPPGADRDARGDEPGGPGDPGVPDEDVLAEQVTALIALLEIMVATPEAPLTVQERAVFDRALYATYSRAGITARRSTHARPAPLLRDLYAVLVEGADDGDATAAGLASRLHRYVAGSLAGLFNGPTNVALDRPFVVFNIQRLEPELRPLAIHVITTFVWGQVRRARRPRLLVVDEAWSVLQYREGGAFLAGLARRARKYYLGLVTITQSVTDFLATEAGRAVLANAALKLLMKQDGAAVDRLVALFDLTAEERQFLLAAGKGEGLLLARGGRVALQIRASAAEHRLATTAPHEVQQLEAPPGNGASPAATADGAPAGH